MLPGGCTFVSMSNFIMNPMHCLNETPSLLLGDRINSALLVGGFLPLAWRVLAWTAQTGLTNPYQTHTHRQDLLILRQRALHISVLPSKRQESSKEVKQRPHSSEHPLDITCTGAQMCLLQSDRHQPRAIKEN